MNYRLAALPPGSAGTDATLREIGRLVKYDLERPAVRFQALKILQSYKVGSKNARREAEALYLWIKRNIRYQKDPVDIETVQSPVVTLRLAAGDCDDHAALMGAMAHSVGILARFRVVGYSQANPIHIWAEVFVGGKWLPVDTTENFGFGGRPKRLPFERIYNLSGEVNMSYGMGALPVRLPVTVSQTKALLRAEVWNVLEGNWRGGLINDADLQSYLDVIDGGNFPTKKPLIVDAVRGTIVDFRAYAPSHYGASRKPTGSMSGMEGMNGFLSSIWKGVKKVVGTVVKTVTGSGGQPITITPQINVPQGAIQTSVSPDAAKAGVTEFLTSPVVLVALGVLAFVVLRPGR
jgi:hypothetical protein